MSCSTGTHWRQHSVEYWILSCALSPRLPPWTWLTCGWCAGSAGSPGPWPAHRWRASRCLPGNGRSAVGDTVGPHPAGGPPPWTCLPRLGRSTWERVRKKHVCGTATHRGVPEVKTPYRSEQNVVELRGQALGVDDLSFTLWLWTPSFHSYKMGIIISTTFEHG